MGVAPVWVYFPQSRDEDLQLKTVAMTPLSNCNSGIVYYTAYIYAKEQNYVILMNDWTINLNTTLK